MANEHILIVEDNPIEARALEALLQKAGLKIAIASDYEEAVQMAESELPRIIIMDISLEGKGNDDAGIQAALEIQKTHVSHIIYLTGIEVSELMIKKIQKTKSFNFLTKPFTDKLLLATINLAPITRYKRESNLVFVAYSHEDIDMVQEMYKFLDPLAEVGIDAWVDTKISYGAKWKDSIEEALSVAKAAILLISIDFVNSRFIKDFELPRLLEAAQIQGTLILPIFIRPVPEGILSLNRLLDFQGINSPTNPMDTWERSRRESEGWGCLYGFLEKRLGLPNEDRSKN